MEFTIDVDSFQISDLGTNMKRIIGDTSKYEINRFLDILPDNVFKDTIERRAMEPEDLFDKEDLVQRYGETVYWEDSW